MKILGYIAGAAIAVGMISFQNGNSEKAEAVFDLNPAQSSFRKSCVSTLSTYDMKFAEGANKNNGCACMAKVIEENAAGEPVNYKFYGEVFGTFVKMKKYNSDTADMVERFGELGKKYDMPLMTVAEGALAAGEALGTCGERSAVKDRMKRNATSQSAPHSQCNKMDDTQKAKARKTYASHGYKFDETTCMGVKVEDGATPSSAPSLRR